jgi:hypothetical protein
MVNNRLSSDQVFFFLLASFMEPMNTSKKAGEMFPEGKDFKVTPAPGFFMDQKCKKFILTPRDLKGQGHEIRMG